jgi:hypothetical protein
MQTHTKMDKRICKYASRSGSRFLKLLNYAKAYKCNVRLFEDRNLLHFCKKGECLRRSFEEGNLLHFCKKGECLWLSFCELIFFVFMNGMLPYLFSFCT